MNVDVATEVQAQAQAGVVTEGVTVHEDDNIIGEEGTALTTMMTQLKTTLTPTSLATPLSSHDC